MKRLFAGLLMLASSQAMAEIVIHDPWVPEAPPVAHALGGFMVMENAGDEPVALIEAQAEGFDRVELHESIEEDGMHKMIKQEQIAIPAHGKTVLKHGSYHIMFIGVHNPPRAGDVIPVRLKFDTEPERMVEFQVRKRQMQMMHGH